VVGITPINIPALREAYRKVCRQYGEKQVLDAINEWREGKDKKARKGEFGPKNFLERECADILDARIDEKHAGGLPMVEDFR
jgi:hypothetical protein